MMEARATVASVRADMQRWKAEQQQREGGDKFVVKTLDGARVPVPEPVQQTMDAQTQSWVEWIDARIEEKLNGVIKAMDQELAELLDKQHEKIQGALDRRDAKIQALRDEVEVKLSLGRKVARLKAEVAEARQMQPNFEDKLNVLEGRVEKVSKQTSRVRTEQSILEYQQKQLNTELSQMKRNAAAPAAVVEFETSSSRITVGNLHRDAANALRRFASEVVDAYDGDPILFSGPAGTA
jgi:DNA repair exonuclease SbcCD ATPase subunit